MSPLHEHEAPMHKRRKLCHRASLSVALFATVASRGDTAAAAAHRAGGAAAFVAHRAAEPVASSSSFSAPPIHAEPAPNALPRHQRPRRKTHSLQMLLPAQLTYAASRSALFRSFTISRGAFSSRSAGRWRRQYPPGIGLLGRVRRWVGQRRIDDGSSPSSTALNMVLTTPESIIEEASTQNLLDYLIDESVRTSARKPIMMQFNPSSGWIWRRWKGTVFSETWTSCVRNMFFATIVASFYVQFPKFIQTIGGFNILWGQLLSVTTFTLTFFLNQSYALWRKCYELSRRLQGRLNDLGMTLAAHAARKTPSSPDDPAEYTAASRQVLELVSRYIRLFNLLTYASFTRSHRPILTPRGMRRLVERGLMTPSERQVLIETELPATQRHNALLLWIIRVFVEGRQAGHFVGGAGFEQQFMEKCHVIRAQYGAIADELQGRMPVAYAHIVQVLVDVILWMYPFMALSTGMTPFLGVLGTGLLTIFYQGLFDLAKQFLDPYDNENYGKGEDPLCVDTLIAETNAGSVRWMNGFEEQPFSSQRLQDGELYDYILPLRGISVAELMEREEREEAERLKREKEKEEAERLKKEQEAERLKKEQEEAERLKKEQEEAERLKKEQMPEEAQRLKEEEGYTEKVFEEEDQEGKAEQANETSVLREIFPAPTAEEDIKKSLEDLGPKTAEEKIEAVIGNSAEETPAHTVKPLEDGSPVTHPNDTFQVFQVEQKAKPEPMVVRDVKEALVGTSSNDETLSHEEEAAKEKVEANRTAEAEMVNGDTVNGDTVAAEIMQTTSGQDIALAKTDDNADDDLPDVYKNRDVESMFPALDWFDEVGPDGKEYRLSQMLADEEWEEELEREAMKAEQKPMTFEDYTKLAEEIIEAAENELLETEEILKWSPGSQSDPDRMETTPKKKSDASPARTKARVGRGSAAKKEAANAYYDQTRLDGISQLWGAPPDVLDMPVKIEPMKDLRYEDYQFEGISQLWGGSLGGPEPEMPPKEPSNVEEINFSGVSQLWGEPLDTPLEGEDGAGARMKKSSATATEDGSKNSDLPFDPETSAYAGFWFDEVGPDGKEYRLSQMLADEEWEEEIEPEESPMTLEEYSKQVAVIKEKAEDEFLETEAILKAPPGASMIDVPDDINELEESPEDRKQKINASSETAAVAEAVMELAEKVAEEAEEQMEKRPAIDDDVLEVLEMDGENPTPTSPNGDDGIMSLEETKESDTDSDPSHDGGSTDTPGDEDVDLNIIL